MNGQSLKLLRILLWTICAFHLVIGAGLNVAPGTAEFMAQVYGAQVAWTPEFTYILKPLGAFMFALGVVAFAAALHPLKNRPAVYAFAALFVIRAAHRLLLKDDIAQIFAISGVRNYANMVFFLLLAAALVVLERKASAAPKSAVAARGEPVPQPRA